MANEVPITLYDIERCGYYRQGEHRFGDLQSLLEDLKSWGTNRELAQTKIFDPSESSNLDPVYLFSILSSPNNEEWLVITWNEVENEDGSIASVPGGDQVGTAKVSSNDVQEGHIPGYPTPFYIIPNENIYATVPLFSKKAGRLGFDEYLRRFLQMHTRHVVHGPREDDGTHQITGYSSHNSAKIENLTPIFKSSVIRTPGDIEQIKKRHTEIRRIIRKASLTLHSQPELTLWQSLLRKTGLSDRSKTSQNLNIKYEFNAKLSIDELEEIINSWENGPKTGWDDVGFQFHADSSSPLWLSSSLCRNKFTIKTYDINTDSASLLATLKRLKYEILSMK